LAEKKEVVVFMTNLNIPEYTFVV